jgi:hypothetical protein
MFGSSSLFVLQSGVRFCVAVKMKESFMSRPCMLDPCYTEIVCADCVSSLHVSKLGPQGFIYYDRLWRD